VEASALQAPATLAQPRVLLGTPLLRLRSDEQLLALFRAGHDEAFRAIHDRYHKRLFAYARQMLPAAQDAEDALQDVFVRAYSGLRASDRELALRAWLFRVAHNRCIDELRRPAPPPPEVLYLVRSTIYDPIAEVELRESLRRLIADVRRLPDQQRSALLMRELGGVSYSDVAASLGISVGAVKSLLVRARIALAQAADARDTACSEIRDELVGAHERGVRPNAITRRHIRDCTGCRSFRRELRGVTRQLAALAPALGPFGALAKALGFSSAGSGATASGATASGSAAIAGGGGAAASASGLALGVNHVATLIAAAVATAGGAVDIQHTIITPPRHPAHVRTAPPRSQVASPLNAGAASGGVASVEPAATAAAAVAVAVATETTVGKPSAGGTTKHGTFKTQSPNSSNAQGAAGTGLATGTDSTSGSGTAGLAVAPAVTGSDTTGTAGSPSCSSTTGGGSPTGTSSGSPPPSSDSTSGTPSSGSQPSGGGSTPTGTGSSDSGTGSSTSATSSSTSGTSSSTSSSTTTTTSSSSSSGSASSSSSSSGSGSGSSSSSSSSTCPSSSSPGSGSSTTPPA
jgi:RNA polymerase sigma factor (sigma-70 family)